jgi:hypothetical protein
MLRMRRIWRVQAGSPEERARGAQSRFGNRLWGSALKTHGFYLSSSRQAHAQGASLQPKRPPGQGRLESRGETWCYRSYEGRDKLRGQGPRSTT